MTERRADDATRDVEAWLKCFYMRDHLGSVFDGTISSVTGFGLFVALDDLYVEGLVHVSELGADYYHFDATKHMMLGERTGKRYRLGDRVRVKVVRVDMESTKIDFVLEAGPTASDSAEASGIQGIDVGAWGAAPPRKAKIAEKSGKTNKSSKTGKSGKRHG
jgi:ribonuclease R